MKKILFLILMIFSLTAFAQTETTFKAGRDYIDIPASASSAAYDPKGSVTVVEFFSYGCPACYHLNPAMETWLSHKPAHVTFERIPVVFEREWQVYARTYYVAKELGISHKISQKIFDAIRKDGKDLSTPEQMADFFQTSFDVKKDIFLKIYNSPGVDAELSNGQKTMNNFLIFQVPGVVVDGKYKVDPSLSGRDPARLIATVNYLIALEKKEKAIR